jgi:putative membrane protein
LLARYPWSPPIYAVSYPLFAQLQIFLGFWLCIRACHKAMKWRWISYFIPAFLISFAMEYGGTTYGIPFGKYTYTSLLGWKIADKVPLLIPISWFCMSLCCYLLSALITGGTRRPIFHQPSRRWQPSLERIGLAALLMIAWDFTLEPAMSQLTPYWVWEESGVFVFGVAVRNLLGWLITGLMIFSSFEALRLGDYVSLFAAEWPGHFYLLNLFLPLGLAMAGGAWVPVFLTTAVLVACLVFALTRGTLRRGLLIRGTAT